MLCVGAVCVGVCVSLCIQEHAKLLYGRLIPKEEVETAAVVLKTNNKKALGFNGWKSKTLKYNGFPIMTKQKGHTKCDFETGLVTHISIETLRRMHTNIHIHACWTTESAGPPTPPAFSLEHLPSQGFDRCRCPRMPARTTVGVRCRQTFSYVQKQDPNPRTPARTTGGALNVVGRLWTHMHLWPGVIMQNRKRSRDGPQNSYVSSMGTGLQ